MREKVIVFWELGVENRELVRNLDVLTNIRIPIVQLHSERASITSHSILDVRNLDARIVPTPESRAGNTEAICCFSQLLA